MRSIWIAAVMLPAAAAAQQVPPPAEQASDDVVVQGLHDLSDPSSAVTHKTLGSAKTGSGARASAEVFGLARRFAHCVVGGSKSTLPLLRAALDGNINSARQSHAQAWLIQNRSTCAQDPAIARSTGIATVTTLYDPSYYDRGALFLETLRKFAPDLRLTPKQTHDAAVQARFDAREAPKARFRLPVDRKYFEVALCLVRAQPELSVRLILTDGSRDTIQQLEAAIVNRGLGCVGNARRVYFDTDQFRFYIADAVYRWAVAVQGRDSLIPND